MSARPEIDLSAQASVARRVSIFEEKYHAFTPALIEAARTAQVDLTPQLERLNKVATLCYGMASVVRIIANNTVAEDTHDPEDPSSEVPLSPHTIGHLENMVAELCHHIAEDIYVAADKLDSQVNA